MKPYAFLLLLLVAALAGTAGWLAGRRTSTRPDSASSSDPTARRVLFYQSPMHPWIKSDQPGKCTICGMDLTPVFEGETGFAVEPGIVALASNSVTVLNVQTAEIHRGALTRTLRVAGTIEEDETRHRFISAYTAGRIEDLYVNYVGAEFEAGQPLARFYSPSLLEAERQFLAVLRSSTSPADGESQLLREAAAHRLRQLGLTETQINALPDKHPTNHFTEILAPAGGTVVRRLVSAGQYVDEGANLLEVADLSTLWFLFDAYEQDLPWLHQDQSVEITTPSLPDQTLEAPIRFIDPNLVEATRSAKVRVEIPNPVVDDGGTRRRLLRQRLYAEGRIAASVPDLLTVPRSAVLSTGDRTIVYLDRGEGAYEQRRVRLGRRGDEAHEVLAGLAPGDRVVVHGNLLIDAQAQLNEVIHRASGTELTADGSAPSHDSHDSHSPPLTPSQRQAVHHLLTLTDQLRAALAADDLPAFHAALKGRDDIQSALVAAFPESETQDALPRNAASALVFEPPQDLRLARKAFLPLSHATVDLTLSLRGKVAEFAPIKVYQCPMTSEAFAGAPPRARWIQFAPPVRNPWFGAEMLECGVELHEEAP